MKLILITLFFITNLQAGNHARFTDYEKIEATYQFNQLSGDNTLYIHNINGSIEVEGYDGDTIMVDIDKTLSSRREENLKLAKKETMFKVVNDSNNMHMFLKTPSSKLEKQDGELHFQERHSSQKYQYKLNYKVKVPRNTNLNIITVNDGNISIIDIQPQLIYAKNINGEIALDKVSGKMEIMTVNGDIALNYLDKNIENGHFKSVNGSFDVNFIEQPDIEITYKTLNGNLYTVFELSDISSFVQKKYLNKKHGVKYKVNSQKVVTIGSGEHKFYFKTINGDINIAEQV